MMAAPPRILNGDLLLMSRVVDIDGKRGQFEPASILTSMTPRRRPVLQR
jgi:hypothetical protein